MNEPGADVTVADVNGVTGLHMLLSDHSTVEHLGHVPRLKKSTPREFDQAPAIAKVCCCYSSFLCFNVALLELS